LYDDIVIVFSPWTGKIIKEKKNRFYFAAFKDEKKSLPV